MGSTYELMVNENLVYLDGVNNAIHFLTVNYNLVICKNDLFCLVNDFRPGEDKRLSDSNYKLFIVIIYQVNLLFD